MVGAVCAAGSVAAMWHWSCARPAASDTTYGVFNLCVHSFFIFFFHLVSITYMHLCG